GPNGKGTTGNASAGKGSTDDVFLGERAFPGTSLMRHVDAIARLIQRTGSTRILDYGAGKAGAYGCARGVARNDPDKALPAWGDNVRIRVYDPGLPRSAELHDEMFDGVISTDVLEHIADDDVPWVLEEMFRRARRFVYLAIACYPDKKRFPNGENVHVSACDPSWWEAHIGPIAQRYPDVEWELAFRVKNWRGKKHTLSRTGGGPRESRKVWLLADDRPGNVHQAQALANALGLPCEIKPLRFNRVAGLHNRLLGASVVGVKSSRVADLRPPWPDVVVAAGRRTAPVARWIGKKSDGRSRLVQLGRKGGDFAAPFDAVVTPAHCRLAYDAKRIETVGPLTPFAVTPRNASGRVFELGAPAPRTLVLIGGPTVRHRFDLGVVAQLVQDLQQYADRQGGSMVVVTSRRTPRAAISYMRSNLSADVKLVRPGDEDAPYEVALREADRIVVTGESESMLSDAAATGRPVLIYPLPEKPMSLALRLGEWIYIRSWARPANRRGTTRPQRGLEYICARLIERGLVRPPRQLSRLHRALYELGIANPFGMEPQQQSTERLCESAQVAKQVLELLALSSPACRDSRNSRDSHAGENTAVHVLDSAGLR
ncbi:MAG: ELM1/GtrOC1 family putative glycosyltransferase, partial [Gammaproteobacteria bacterium]|nr:ELM1/GtrOC1 family putative glycosyltransferase [Gammaproteobacteria bacterium]